MTVHRQERYLNQSCVVSNKPNIDKACLGCSPENLKPKFKIDIEFCLGNISPIRQVFGVGVVWKTFSPSPYHPPSFNRRMSGKGYTLPAYDLFLRLLKC